jgi:hypothetical protein
MKANRYSALLTGLALILPGSLLLGQGYPQQTYPQQTYPQQGYPPQAYPQQQPIYGGQGQAPAQVLSQDQLENLVAPIALYPDALLSQILVAATYPEEVAEAGQWLQQNGNNLRGQDLVAAASRQPWDASVQALVAFPDVVNRLNSDIGWTTDLGNAFLAQQGDVMNAVQALRVQARSNGRLQSDQRQIVTTEAQGPQSVIEIQPADPQVVYVPSYNPEYIWGPPTYGYYPSLYYPEFGFSYGYGIPIGGYFGGLGWSSWGWGPNWFGRSIYVNSSFFGRYGFNGYRGGRFGGGGSVWAHNPDHRRGIPYSNSRVANNFHGTTGGRAPFSGGRSNGFSGSNGFSSGQRSNQFNASRPQAGSSQGFNRFGNGQSRSDVNAGGNRGAQSFRSGPQPSGNVAGGGFRSTPNAPSYNSSPRFFNGGSANQSSPRFNGGGQSFRAPAQSRPAPSVGGGGGGGFRSAPRSNPNPQSFRAPAQQSRAQSSGGGHPSHGGGGGGGGSRGNGGGGSRSARR